MTGGAALWFAPRMSLARAASCCSLVLALHAAASPALAQTAAGASTGVGATATTSTPPPDAQSRDHSSGPPVEAVVAFVIAGAAFAAGTGILVYGAFKTADENEEADLATISAIDPGIGGSRGFTGESGTTATGAVEEPSSRAPYDIGAALLGGGAVALTVGLVLAYMHEPAAGDKKETAKLRVRPTRNGVRFVF